MIIFQLQIYIPYHKYSATVVEIQARRVWPFLVLYDLLAQAVGTELMTFEFTGVRMTIHDARRIAYFLVVRSSMGGHAYENSASVL